MASALGLRRARAASSRGRPCAPETVQRRGRASGAASGHRGGGGGRGALPLHVKIRDSRRTELPQSAAVHAVLAPRPHIRRAVPGAPVGVSKATG